MEARTITEQVEQIVVIAKRSVMGKSDAIITWTGKDTSFYVMLRWSRPLWDGYATVDVVQICWAPLYQGEKRTLEEKKKLSAAPLWDAMEQVALKNGRILRVECALQEKLLKMLMEKRAYVLQSGTTNCLLCRK
jgi:hypothetical protein